METIPPPKGGRKKVTRKSMRYYVYLASLLVSLHYSLIVYINSSFLSKFFSSGDIGWLYFWGSLINTVLLILNTKMLQRVSLRFFAIAFALLELFAVVTFSLPGLTAVLAGLAFIVHQTSIFMLLYAIDIYLEEATENESETGETRGFFLTLYNMMLVISPAIVALILIRNEYWRVYIASVLIIIPLIFLIRMFLPKLMLARSAKRSRVISGLKAIWADKSLLIGAVCSLILQVFYAFMVVYVPLYLHEHIGFSWQQLGVMFTIMLLPFVLFELPIGYLSDKKYGEREIMSIGFFVMTVFTIFISFTLSNSFLVWATILFLTRVGASAVEITTESYFFKHVKSKNTDTIGVFRTAHPLSFMIAPMIAGLALAFLDYRYMFLILAIPLIIGGLISLKIKDTL